MQGVTHAFYNNSKMMSDKTSEYVCSGCNQIKVYQKQRIIDTKFLVFVSRMTDTATSNFADVTINDPEFFCENSVTE